MNFLNKLIDNLPGFNWAAQPNSGDWRILIVATFYGTLAGILTRLLLELLL